ncbi:hypothetical protein [Microcoleus sp. AR_TQ3_B6]|uniref:hypothetical protein n=1 Tax=Microcoleus sp. AR_TQ3_B6 TaxID=3055284 RepID=UPI002FD6E43E
MVDINKKLENLPILGLAIFGVNATGTRSPDVDRLQLSFPFHLKTSLLLCP